MSEYDWELIIRIPGNHKFFIDKISQNLAICDYSGNRPDLTDDGVLWVIRDKPLLFTNDSNRFLTPVFSVRKFGMQLQLQHGDDSMLFKPVADQVKRHPLVPL